MDGTVDFLMKGIGKDNAMKRRKGKEKEWNMRKTRKEKWEKRKGPEKSKW